MLMMLLLLLLKDRMTEGDKRKNNAPAAIDSTFCRSACSAPLHPLERFLLPARPFPIGHFMRHNAIKITFT